MKNKFPKVLVGVLLVLAVWIGFVFVSSGTNNVLSNVEISGLDVTGQSYDDVAYDLDAKYLALLEKNVIVEFEGEVFETNLRSLGVEFDTYKTLELAYESSQVDGFLGTMRASVLGAGEEVEVDAAFEIDRVQMESALSDLIPGVIAFGDAQVVIGEDLQVESVEESGFALDFDDIYDQVYNSLLALTVPEIEAKRKIIVAEYGLEGSIEDASILQSILDREIVFRGVETESIGGEKVVQVQSDWVSVEGGEVEFDKEAIERFILDEVVPDFDVQPVDAVIRSFSAGSPYAEVSGIARDGRELDVESAVHRVTVASSGRYGGDNPVVMEFLATEGGVLNETGVDLGEMVLLGRGRSNFAGSPSGRDFNVRKGLNEKFNNVLVAPGETFSYNELLGPVTHRAGWQDSLAIFGGNNLVAVPGGGLCQVSTTMYRALVDSGLNVAEKSNHSLYIHYYQAYGDGLDAAIYPGVKDLRFVNDTPSYVLIQAYADGDDAYVNVYGTSDGRSVTLNGPFYYGEVGDEFRDKVSPRRNQVMWLQEIVRPDGVVEEEVLTSTYRTNVR